MKRNPLTGQNIALLISWKNSMESGLLILPHKEFKTFTYRIEKDGSARPVVRQYLLTVQHALGSEKKAVFEGRDMGTVVFPGADLKFFMDASVEVRSMRRFNEFKDQNRQSIGEVEADIRRRDKNDSTRAVAPLRVAEDAIVVDATDLTVDQVVETMLKHARQKLSGG